MRATGPSFGLATCTRVRLHRHVASSNLSRGNIRSRDPLTSCRHRAACPRAPVTGPGSPPLPDRLPGVVPGACHLLSPYSQA